MIFWGVLTLVQCYCSKLVSFTVPYIEARFKTHDTAPPHGGHILTFKLKKSLEISKHLGGKDINFGFGGGGGPDINFV